jgi:hypothetical protein
MPLPSEETTPPVTNTYLVTGGQGNTLGLRRRAPVTSAKLEIRTLPEVLHLAGAFDASDRLYLVDPLLETGPYLIAEDVFLDLAG